MEPSRYNCAASLVRFESGLQRPRRSQSRKYGISNRRGWQAFRTSELLRTLWAKFTERHECTRRLRLEQRLLRQTPPHCGPRVAPRW